MTLIHPCWNYHLCSVGLLFALRVLQSSLNFRDKLGQFKKEATEEKIADVGAGGKLPNGNSKLVELPNEDGKDKSAAAC